MKLSQQLKQDNDSGDFGRAIEGYSERAEELENEVKKLKSLIGRIYRELEYGEVYQWDGGQQVWKDMRAVFIDKRV